MTLQAAATTRRDLREEITCTDRDFLALEYVLEGQQECQPNVDRAIFNNRSKTPCARSIQRLVAAGFLKAERWNGLGANFLRGTNAGRAALVARGVDASRLFVPERPIATKDLVHHMWLNGVRLVLRERGFSDVTPCWALRRRLAAFHPPAIPDVLAFRVSSEEKTEGVLAVEVDMGSEPLKVLVPKLHLLRSVMSLWAAGAPSAILVLTVGPRRIQALAAAVPPATVVQALPKEHGRKRLSALAALLEAMAGTTAKK